MLFDELRNNLKNLFPKEKNESIDAYVFYIKEACSILINHRDYDKCWDEVMGYDGNTKRPRLAFYKSIVYAGGNRNDKVFSYYKCSCGELLSDSSNGGCPICHKTTAERQYSKDAKKVLRCQSSCFDCSIYSEYVNGPTCEDYGTPKFEDCQGKRSCKCVECCRFEYLRSYHPERLKIAHVSAMRALPQPLSEAAKAFRDGRASIEDIKGFLRSRDVV